MHKEKKNPLQAALKAVPQMSSPSGAEPNISKLQQKPRARPDRKDTVMIGGHFPRSYKQQLRMIAAEEDTTSQALLEEALNLLFVKKGRGKMA